MTRRQSITIKEVAELAAVSQMTVSRVLNNAAAVRPETRERVQNAIRELNYRPNLMARNLARGQSKLLGLLYQNASAAYLSELLVSALQQCRTLGHHLVLEDAPLDADGRMDPKDVAARISVIGLDGLIVTPLLARNADLIEELSKLPLKLILLGTNDVKGDCAKVSFDDHAGAKRLTQYLIDQGHSKIAYISGQTDCPAGEARYRGYKDALAEKGLSEPSQSVKSGTYTFESGMKAADEIFSGKDGVTAIFCANDEMAAGAIAAAHRKGLKLPGEISITGFDDTEIASIVWPQITTIRQPIGRMAELAIEYLAKGEFPKSVAGARIVDPSDLEISEFDLIERDSVSKLA